MTVTVRDVEYLICGKDPTFTNTPGAGQDKVGYKRVFYRNVTDNTQPKALYVYQRDALISEPAQRRRCHTAQAQSSFRTRSIFSSFVSACGDSLCDRYLPNQPSAPNSTLDPTYPIACHHSIRRSISAKSRRSIVAPARRGARCPARSAAPPRDRCLAPSSRPAARPAPAARRPSTILRSSGYARSWGARAAARRDPGASPRQSGWFARHCARCAPRRRGAAPPPPGAH